MPRYRPSTPIIDSAPGNPPAPAPPTPTQQPKHYVVDSNVFMAGRTAILPYVNDKNVVIHLPEAAYAQVQPFPDNIYRPVFVGGARITYLLQNGTITKAPIILESDPDMTGIDLRHVSVGGVISNDFDVPDAKIVETARAMGLTLLTHNATGMNNQIGSVPQRKARWGGVTIREP